MILGTDDFQRMDRRVRATFFNSLAGIRPAVLVGTRSPGGVNNLAVFNSMVHIGADPPRNALLFRPETVERHSLDNLRQSGFYSINFVRTEDYKKAHQTSAKYPADVSEFDAVGFTPVFLNRWSAPMVQEAPIRMYMSYEYETEIPVNGTVLVVGRIEKVFLTGNWSGQDGYVDHQAADSLACVGLDAYFRLEAQGRLPYARPEQALTVR